MEYVKLLTDAKRELVERRRVSTETLDRIDAELRRNPSVELWIFRGDAIQLSASSYSLDEAENSYRRAIELDTSRAEAYESLGYFILAVKNDAAESIHYFREAIRLGAGASARHGLRQAEDESHNTIHDEHRWRGRT